MEIIQISRSELEEIIERKFKDLFIRALMEFVPYVSDEEQEEIDRVAGIPEDYKEEFEEWNGK